MAILKRDNELTRLTMSNFRELTGGGTELRGSLELQMRFGGLGGMTDTVCILPGVVDPKNRTFIAPELFGELKLGKEESKFVVITLEGSELVVRLKKGYTHSSDDEIARGRLAS